MQRHKLLQELQERLEPRTYLEIGVSTGGSLRYSRVPTIGVDPAFRVRNEVLCDVYLARATSDEFFARQQPLAHFPIPVIDLAFIDGMHLAEYALRDLMNVERYTTPASVVVLDDMLPRNVDEARRDRFSMPLTGSWAGDVYKVTDSVRKLRPDLVWLEVDTRPTGTVVVLNPDRSSTALADAYDELVEEYVVPDPQPVPDAFLRRTRAVAPERLLASGIWSELRRLRTAEPGRARDEVAELVSRAGLVPRAS